MVPTFLLQDAHLWAINWLNCTQGWEVSSCLSYRERGPGGWRACGCPQKCTVLTHTPQQLSKGLPHTSFCGRSLRRAASHSPCLPYSAAHLCGWARGSLQGARQEKSLYRVKIVRVEARGHQVCGQGTEQGRHRASFLTNKVRSEPRLPGSEGMSQTRPQEKGW